MKKSELVEALASSRDLTYKKSEEIVNIQGSVERRHSLTTVSGHHILIVFSGNGRPRVYANTDPNVLLDKIND